MAITPLNYLGCKTSFDNELFLAAGVLRTQECISSALFMFGPRKAVCYLHSTSRVYFKVDLWTNTLDSKPIVVCVQDEDLRARSMMIRASV